MAETLVAAPDPQLYGVFHGAGESAIDRYSFAEAIFEAAARRGHPAPVVNRVKSADFFAAAPRPAYSAMSSQKLLDVYKVSIPGWRDRLDEVVAGILTAQGQRVDVR
jgi:dTDP-4-dehydrorhamnose reductase